MSSIVEVRVGKYTYLYESESYRNAKGEARNKRKLIGKIDPKTGRRRFKPEYIERMKAGGVVIESDPADLQFSADAIRNSTLREYGALYLIKELAKQDGLLTALRVSLPRQWKEVFLLASFLAVKGEALAYCEEWVLGAEELPLGSLSLKRIAELLASISADDRAGFYRAWRETLGESEYLALNITASSAYSSLVDPVEWGFNREGELGQVNICLLVGEKSALPVFLAPYSGSIRDVSALEATLTPFRAIVGERPELVVMDKGFYSQENITTLLKAKTGCRFVAVVPFTSAFAKQQVEAERKDIDQARNAFALGANTVYAVTKTCGWGESETVYTHVYFDAKKAREIRDALHANVALLREEAEGDPSKCAKSVEHCKYLDIGKSGPSGTGYSISIREDIVEGELQTAGWLVLVSNAVTGAQEALRLYQTKDVVEKGFEKLKDNLDLGRIRVNPSDQMHNKLFIGFVTLIILAKLHHIMAKKNLYKTLTLPELMRVLSKLRRQEVDGTTIMHPVTKEQRRLFAAFGVKIPT
ncbi:MAG: IS1634 family transposase [Planctomycetota bacterium]|jgi:hypothetical protein|nr:IS1634 family transposase [Planctomycetota bacterium]